MLSAHDRRPSIHKSVPPFFPRNNYYPCFASHSSIVMVFGLFEKEETTEDIADHLTPSPSKPSLPPEAAITAWCRKNRASSGTA